MNLPVMAACCLLDKANVHNHSVEWGARPPRAQWLAPSPTTFTRLELGSAFGGSPRFGASRQTGVKHFIAYC